MNIRASGDTVPAALRQLLAQILLALRSSAPMLLGPLACRILGGAWAVFLFGTGAADVLGRMVPWPVSSALFMALLIVTIVGGFIRHPDSFPHETAWKKARAVFVAAGTVASITCYLALPFADPHPLVRAVSAHDGMAVIPVPRAQPHIPHRYRKGGTVEAGFRGHDREPLECLSAAGQRRAQEDPA